MFDATASGSPPLLSFDSPDHDPLAAAVFTHRLSVSKPSDKPRIDAKTDAIETLLNKNYLILIEFMPSFLIQPVVIHKFCG